MMKASRHKESQKKVVESGDRREYRYQLSQVLNEKLGQNLSDYINGYRLEEAKQILSDPKNKNKKIDKVASEVGYNTRVAFYRVFKKYTNMTPTKYRKEAVSKK